MIEDFEIETMIRSHVDVRSLADDGMSQTFEYIAQLTDWFSDECARRPILSDLLVLSVSRSGGGASFDSLVDCVYGHPGPRRRDKDFRTVLSVVVGPADSILARAGDSGIDTLTPLLVWVVGDGSTDALLTVHERFDAMTRRTVADESTSPLMFMSTCQTLVHQLVRGLIRGVPSHHDSSCGSLVESASLSAQMRGVGYAVS